MEHTPEPWKCEKIDGAIYVYSPELSLSVCRMTDRTIEGQNQNARRIVACVNACAGLSTETLETFGQSVTHGMAHYLGEARAGEQNNADLAQHYFKELTQRTADRDRWKALAVEAGLQLENVRDYAIECQNNVLDDGRERYVRQKRLIQDDIDSLDLALAKLQEAQNEQ